MSFHPTDDDLTRMLRARAARDVPVDLRDTVAAAIQADARQRPPRRRSGWRGPVLLVAATLAIIAVGALGPLMGGRPQQDRVAVPPGVPSNPLLTSSRPTQTGTPQPVVAYSTWQESPVGLNARTVSASVTDVAAYSDGYVAVGWASTQPDAQRAAVWTSVDGNAWQMAADDPAFADFLPAAVAANGRAIVIVGWLDVNGTQPGAALISTDGRTWRQVRTPSFRTVTASPDGFIAVTNGTPPDDQPKVWTSPDGRAWTQAADPGATLGSGSISRIRFTVAGGPYRLVALGSTPATFGFGYPLVWVAPGADATSLIQNVLPDADNSIYLIDVAGSTADGLLAIGMKGYCCRARAWTSPDANRWTSLGDPIGLPGLKPTSVVATPSGFLVTAIKYTKETVGTLRAWSVDGSGWNEIPTESLGIGTRRMGEVVATTRPDGAVLVLAGLGPIEPDAAGSPSGSESPSAAWRPAAWVVR